MDTLSKKIITIDLTNQTYEVNNFRDVSKYIGGIGLGLKLMETYIDKNPVIFSIGPLNGFFPFASKTSVVLNNDGVIEDIYLGGNISSCMKYAGIDSIVMYGTAQEKTIVNILNTEVQFKDETTDIGSLGLPGKRSVISAGETARDKILLNDYFTSPENFLETAFAEKNLKGMVVTGKEIFKIKSFDKYNEIYNKILARKTELAVEQNAYPSCANCPMGCGKSKTGEIGGNVMIHSLVACEYANTIYSDIGIVFSCLNVLGYDYTHEDIENLPALIETTLKRLSDQ
jgi:aldehyde:ferredoxin oxidoreductase